VEERAGVRAVAADVAEEAERAERVGGGARAVEVVAYGTNGNKDTSAYFSIRQHTSAYVILSIPQHTSVYVSIRQQLAYGTNGNKDLDERLALEHEPDA
jgi:hypothetical protein